MERTKQFQATDPRDKLFALPQLASDAVDPFVHDPLITPDYTKPIECVISDFVRWQIRRSVSLRVLINPDAIDRPVQSNQLPSWAPAILKPDAWVRQSRSVFQERAQNESGQGRILEQLSAITCNYLPFP
jgi:hypothetical protein